MRKTISSTFISLDGVINHMEHWHFDYIDDDTGAIVLEQLQASDAVLMGRATYEAYAAVWPDRDEEYAQLLNSMDKYVASTTLSEPAWNNTTVLDGDLIESVRALKEAGDGDILLHGYGPVAKALLRHGLLDELFLWVHPVLAGVGSLGDTLLDDGLHAVLTPLDVRRLESGVVILHYSAQQP